MEPEFDPFHEFVPGVDDVDDAAELDAIAALPPGFLVGDSVEATFVDTAGTRFSWPHHDDWRRIRWRGEAAPPAVHPIYRDASHVPDEAGIPWLLMEPAHHIYTRRTPRIVEGMRMWGSGLQLRTAWDAAPQEVRDLLYATPFGALLEFYPRGRRSLSVAVSLGERWWDTTHTFMFRWGEMTLTPLDLYMLTGITFGDIPVVVSTTTRFTPAGIEAAIGPLTVPDGSSVTRGAFIRHLRWFRDLPQPLTRQQVRQYARCILLLMFQSFIIARGQDRVLLCWLPYLRYFDRIRRFDWGGLTLSVLYDSMDAFSRGLHSNHRGLSMIWDVSMNLFVMYL